MIVHSFIRDGFGLQKIEIELSIVPGLPQMKFLGMPDGLIKESEARIKTAIRNQGFEIPASKQVLIQLRPNDIKKHSRGLDLAVAAAFLWETEQLPKPERPKPALYGELNFNGEVIAPLDFCDVETLKSQETIITGKSETDLGFDYLSVNELRTLSVPTIHTKQDVTLQIVEPSVENLFLSKAQARLAMIIAAGEHSALFAGPPGTGKSTMAEYISKILCPNYEDLKMSAQIARYFGEKLEWIPTRRPHHKSTLLSMIGAGRPPEPGEVTRAHGGVLIMDEFLEFDSKLQEALREPIETGKIMISRAGAAREFPAKFLLLATTNLCKCGQLIPSTKNQCQCRTVRKRQYVERLSGPILDRFQIISFSHEYSQEHDVSLTDIRHRVKRAREFAQENRKQHAPNSRISSLSVEKDISPSLQKVFKLKMSSQRRLKSVLQVARTIADLSESREIRAGHLNEALALSLRSATRIQVDLQRYI